MYAPRQHRQEKKKPYSNFLALEQAEHEGPIMAPPVYSATGQNAESEEKEAEKDEKKDAKPEAKEATEQNAVQNNRQQQETEGAESEADSSSAESKTVQKKQLGRSENPPQFKLKAGAPFQFKFANAPVQMKAGSGGGGSESSGPSGIPDEVMGKMESTFNTDFSNVNIVQNSSKASEAGALAYAQGNDVHFAPGQFSPETPGGQQLLGHELSHVVQQRQGRVQANSAVNGMAVNNDHALEAEADAMGAKAAQMKVDASPAAKTPSTAAAPVSAPTQLKADPNAKTEGKSAKEKEDEKEDGLGQVVNYDPTLALDGFTDHEDKNEEQAGEENAKSIGEVQSVDEANKGGAEENQQESSQLPANVTEATPVGDQSASEDLLEEESPEAETEEKQSEPESEEGTKEGENTPTDGVDGATNGQGAKKEGGKEGGKEQKQSLGKEGGNDAGKERNASGGANAEPVAPIESVPAVMGDFGASEPNPQLAVMPMELAKGLGADQIVQENGDGSVIVKGVDTEDAETETESIGSDTPIQMAPDPDHPKNKKKKNATKPVQKVPEEVTNQIFDKKQADAHVLVDAFKSENEAKVQTLKNLAATISPAIEAKATESKAVVEASVNTNRQAIADDILVKQEAARTEATRMEGVIKGQYDATLIKIKASTTTEKGLLKDAADKSEKAIAKLETDAIKSATDAFNGAEKDARAAGKTECDAVDSRIAALISGYSDPEEKVVTAMKNAATDVGKAFKEKLVEAANGVANEIPKGKEAYLKGIADKIKEARDKNKAFYDGGIQQIEASEKGSIEAADANLKGQKDAVKALLDGTIKSLDDLQTSQVKAVEDAGIASTDNIDKIAKDSIKGLTEQLNKAVTDIENQIADTVTKASAQKNPDEAALKQLLKGVSANITKSIDETTKKINTGVIDSGKSINESGLDTDATLIEMAADAAILSQEQVDGQVKTHEEVEKGSQKAFDDTAKRHDEAAKKAVADMGKEMDKVCKETGDGFKKADEGLAAQFKTKIADLTKDLKAITKDLDSEVKKNVEEAAAKAREPWWKTALKWIVTIVVMIVVTALIIAFCPLTLGGLLLAFAIGAAGAVVALFLKDLIDGTFHSLKEYIVEAIAGGIGGVFTLLGGKLGEMAAGAAAKWVTNVAAKVVVKFAADVIVGTICDTIGSGVLEIAKNLALGKEVSWNVFFTAMKDNLVSNFLGNFGGSLLGAWIGKTKIGQTIAKWMGKGTGEVVESAVEAEAKALAEAEAKALAEAEAKTLAEAEAKKIAEAEAKQVAEAEAKRLAEEEAKKVAEAEAKRLAEEQAKQAAEAESKRIAEEESKRIAEEQAKKLAENEAKQAAEAEAKRIADEEARRLAEEETRRLAEQEAKDLAEREAKEAAEKAAKKTGAELAEDLGYPKAPDGYHWTRNGDSPTPGLQRNPGAAATLPPVKFDPTTKKFIPEVDPPTGFNWQWRDGKLVLARNPGMKNALPKLEYDPTSPSGFKNLDTGKPYISHLDVRDAIKAKIDGHPSAKLTLDDDQIKALIDKGQSLGFSKADIDAFMALAARKHWVTPATLHEVMDMIAAKAAGNTIPFKPGWDFMQAWRVGQDRLLAGGKLAPEEYLDPTYIANHMAQFNGKASYVVTEQVYRDWIEGRAMVGRPDGHFLSTAADIDDAFARAGGDPRKLEQILGFSSGHFGSTGVWRIDVLHPEALNMRLPSGVEAGANEFWIPGGKTSGGAMEVVSDQIPQANIDPKKLIP